MYLYPDLQPAKKKIKKDLHLCDPVVDYLHDSSESYCRPRPHE